MESARHWRQMVLLVESLEFMFRDRDDFFAGGNMFLYFSEAQTRKNDFRGPDVFVVLGTEHRERQAWVVWLEGGKTPDVIIELTSPSTEKVDRVDKKALYERLKIGEYFIYDPFTHALDGFELDVAKRVYTPKAFDAAGRLSCSALGLSLGTVTSRFWETEIPWLRWIDGGGVPLPLPAEAAIFAEAKAERAEAKAEQAEAKAEQAEAKAERAEAKAERAETKIKQAEELLAEYRRRFGSIED